MHDYLMASYGDEEVLFRDARERMIIMKRVYLVKKDPDLPAKDDNWITMNSYEFRKFMETEEGKKRKANFGMVPPADENDAAIFIECTPEDARRLKRENAQWAYQRMLEYESGYTTVSLEELISGDEGSGIADMILDEDMDTEAAVLKKTSRDDLIDAVMQLGDKEREVILARYFISEEKTVGELAQEMGLTRKQFLYRHNRAMKQFGEILKRSRYAGTDRDTPGSERMTIVEWTRKHEEAGK